MNCLLTMGCILCICSEYENSWKQTILPKAWLSHVLIITLKQNGFNFLCTVNLLTINFVSTIYPSCAVVPFIGKPTCLIQVNCQSVSFCFCHIAGHPLSLCWIGFSVPGTIEYLNEAGTL